MRRLVIVAVISMTIGTLFGAVGSTAYAERQPHMNKALHHLREARRHLKLSSWDKGGHRVKAIGQTQKAINQTKKGIAFDNKN